MYLLIDEDGYAVTTDMEPDLDPISWPKVIRIRQDNGEAIAETYVLGGWTKLPDDDEY